MRYPKVTVAVMAVIFLVVTAVDAKPKKKCGATSFSNCPKQGCGGDPQLNRKKNKTTKPAAADTQPMSLSDIAALDSPITWQRGSPRTQLEQIAEGTPVVVNAFLIHAKHYPSGAESCNCNLTKSRNNDFHIVLVANQSDEEADSVTAEISPRVRPAAWTIIKLRALAKQRTYVQVTGWLMLDTQHIKLPLKRLTNWEIHPVTKFEVCKETKAICDQGQGWKPL